jgi:Tfp pilus assembly major pilin PilA
MSIRKVVAARLAVMTITLSSCLQLVQAQEAQPEKSATSATQEIKPKSESKPEDTDKPVHAYRVDFSVNELEDGKKINTRHYSMNVNSGDRNQVKISSGARISKDTGATSEVPTEPQPDFLNVTTHIYCRVQERGDEVLLAVDGVISNVLNPPKSRPVSRDIDIMGSTVATLGKPVIIGSVDDPASNREFQLEVTATKLK